MLTNRLEEVCKQLRLSYLFNVVETDGFETKEAWLLFLLENELNCREEVKTARLFKQAKFPARRSLETYDWHDHITLPNPTTKEELTSLFYSTKGECVICRNAWNWENSLSLCVGTTRDAVWY